MVYTCVCSAHGWKKRTLGPRNCSARSCEPPCEGWELNPGLCQEEQVPLTTELSYRPPQLNFKSIGRSCFCRIFLAGPVCDGEDSVQSLPLSNPCQSVLALKWLSLLNTLGHHSTKPKRALGHQGYCFFSRIFSWKQTLQSPCNHPTFRH